METTPAGLFVHATLILTAYHMQLFLYLKGVGFELGTRECWFGQDAPAVGG